MIQRSLSGLRVLDLSRVLAGPFCTQILGDLGAEILKIEKPGEGDDTRNWGPPYLKDAQGHDTHESAYYLSCNRNKRSVAIDLKQPEGQKLIRKLVAQSDIFIENFKVGGLEKYGLSYPQIKDEYPRLIYCSITGFGQTGPLAAEPGYDFLAQGMSGLMAATGPAHGGPTKAGIAVSDIFTGLYAAIGILAALNHREKTGQGQHVDVALLDCTLATMTNIAQYYLTSGQLAPRVGNAHSTIVPYQDYQTRDSHIIIAVGNDPQFERFATHLGHAQWAQDPRFMHNQNRVQNRDALNALIAPILKTKTTQEWIDGLYAVDVPCGPVQNMKDVFGMPQIAARAMKITLPHPQAPQPIDLVGSPLKLSQTPVGYDHAPPTLGADTDDVLTARLGLDPATLKTLREQGVIG